MIASRPFQIETEQTNQSIAQIIVVVVIKTKLASSDARKFKSMANEQNLFSFFQTSESALRIVRSLRSWTSEIVKLIENCLS